MKGVSDARDFVSRLSLPPGLSRPPDFSSRLACPGLQVTQWRMHALVPLLFLATTALHTAGGASVAPDSIPLPPGIRDPVFAYLTGLVDTDVYGSIDADVLRGVIGRTARSSKLPYTYLRLLTRESETPGRTARVEVSFDKPLGLQIPYQILGYHPGRLRATADVGLREWILGSSNFAYMDAEKKRQEVTLSDIHLFAVLDGTLWVDIDGWLDNLVGGKLDDTRITGLVLFQSGEERFGMAVGYNRNWEGRSGLLSLRDDEIKFPSPLPMRAAAWKLRQILEALEPRLRPDSLRAGK
jgi:hypothetical protein